MYSLAFTATAAAKEGYSGKRGFGNGVWGSRPQARSLKKEGDDVLQSRFQGLCPWLGGM
jgi:hypothetical protein